VTTPWERLNAYVDGELGPAEAAEVAAAIARDRELAARVASLTRLKAVASSLPPQHVPPPAPLLRAPTRRRNLMLPAAAALVLLILAAIAGWSWLPGPHQANRWLAQAAAAHQAWIDGTAPSRAPAQALAALASGKLVHIPDLSDAHLSLVQLSAQPDAGSVFLGYRGIHGCQVGLWIGSAPPDLDPQPLAVASGDIAGYAWRFGETGYALLAQGMDPDRLKLLAEAVAKIVSRDDALDQEIRAALHNSSVIGAPCQA
jgi:anti-sigma factor RsiW